MTFRRYLLAALALLLATPLPFAATATAADPADPDAPVVMNMVLIHGAGSSPQCWDRVVPFMTHGFELWLYEIPGHGQKPPLRNLSIESATQDLALWLQENGVTEPIVVGHGIGGMIAMNYAFRHAHDVQKLIIIDAAPRQLADRDQKAETARRLAEDYDAFVAGYFLNLSPDEEVTGLIVDQALRTEQISLTQLLVSSFDFDVTEDLYYQTVPIMVIGTATMLPEPDHAMDYLDAMGYANAQTISYKTMPHNGHFVMLEAPQATAGVIIGWSLLK